MALPIVTKPAAREAAMHRLRALEGKPSGSLVVHEIYRSLQGESTFAGLPCVFIRLTACHLRCSYCDTAHAFHRGDTLSLDEVAAKALSYGDDLIEITGGEPLLQAETYPLMSLLADKGRTVLLETSGAVNTTGVDPRVRIILDLKTPDSGESEANVDSNLNRLRPTDELKVVVCSRDDFQWAIDRIRERDLTQRCAVLMSPAHDRIEGADLARWILETSLPIRLQIQMHKILWGATARGV